MSGEILAILAVGVALAGVILTSNRGLRQDMAQLRRDMREDMGKLESRLPRRHQTIGRSRGTAGA